MHAADLSHAIWLFKYCLTTQGGAEESNIHETWRRVARAAAQCEKRPDIWADRFESLVSDFQFLPGGRIIAGAGSDRQVTLFNCFVAGKLEDSPEGIRKSLEETAITMQQGGGVGIDFSSLRPSGCAAVRAGSAPSGPVSFMDLWDVLCGTLLSTSARRGAMMGTLACDHPDIESFVNAKKATETLRNFNLSVLINDRFMKAVQNDDLWPLEFPSRLIRSDAASGALPHTYRMIRARSLWRAIAAAAHASGEPGVLFIDTINRENNLSYCESISATNPCGEIPLPPYGACDLGSVNLTSFVRHPFSRGSYLDLDRIQDSTSVAVRFLDNIVDVSRFPLEQQARQARRTRRIGLGITGLADTLAMLGLRYSSKAGIGLAISALQAIRDSAYRASIELAAEKGSFACLEKSAYLKSPFIRRLPGAIKEAIAKNGIRNSHLLSIAPAGTISLLAGNVSSGIEPIYALEATRAIRNANGTSQEFRVRDFAFEQWRSRNKLAVDTPDVFETAASLPAAAHLAMQASLQPLVDSGISKTINLASDASIDDVVEIYSHAYASGVKGCTVFRPGATVGHVLRTQADMHRCNAGKEAS